MNQAPSGYSLQQLTKQNRDRFDCGIDALNHYLKQQASQDQKRNLAVVYLLICKKDQRIAGYYSLSAASIDLGDLTDSVAKKLPKYERFPATLLGRLAVDNSFQGEGLGQWLLMDACLRSFQSSERIASLAMLVDAIDDRAARFYQKFGFIPFPSRPDRLFLPMKTIAMLMDCKP